MPTIKRVFAALFGSILLATPITTQLNAQTLTLLPAPLVFPMDTPVITPIHYPRPLAVVTANVWLDAGETRRVYGRASWTNSSTGVYEALTGIECYGADGVHTGFSDTNQNHDGKNTHAGPSYPYQGLLALYPAMLLHAWASQNYTCQLLVSTDSAQLSVVAKDPAGASATYLRMSSADEKGATWWQNLSCGTDTVPTKANNYSSCIYLGGPLGKSDIYEFENDGSPVHLWEVPPGTAFVAADANIQVSVCYYQTGSCAPAYSENALQHIADPGGTEVESHMELIQLDSLHQVCNVTESPDHLTWIDNNSHHYVLYYSVRNAPYYPGCGSDLYKIRVYLKYLSGNPLKIEGSSLLPEQTIFTHAYVYTSAKGEAVPVPDVLTLSQGAATASITDSGYTVSTVTDALNTAPSGSVIAQYPAPGTIAYPGTGVAITVSTGGAVVPDLISLPEGTAVSEINSLGLVPSVSFTKACINPGEVLTQSPLPTTTVPLPTTVYITIDSGTNKTCVIK